MLVKSVPFSKLVWFVLVAWSHSFASLFAAEGTWTQAETTRLLYRGEYSQASVRTEQYLKTHPNDSAARILLARALLSQGNYLRAYSELTHVVRSDRRNIDGLYYLARTAAILSQLEYQELVHEAPDYFRVHQLLAESYKAQENRVKAEEEYLAAVNSNPQSSELLDDLADLKRDEFQFDQAAKYYERAAQVSRRDYRSKYGLGACALFAGEFFKAVEYFREAAAIDPNSAAVRLALGDALLRDNKTLEGIDELKAAVKIQPDMRQAYSLLARAYAKVGELQLAQDAIQKEQELARVNHERLERTLDTDKGLILVAPESGGAPGSVHQPEGPP